jgi:hypothetical protein
LIGKGKEMPHYADCHMPMPVVILLGNSASSSRLPQKGMVKQLNEPLLPIAVIK